MTSGYLRRRRSGAQKAVLSTIAAWVFVISAVSTGLIVYLSAATDSGVREAVGTAPTAERTTQVTTRLMTNDPEGQDSALRTEVDRSFADVEVSITRSLVEEPAALEHGPSNARGVVMAYADIADHAELGDGSWPSPASTNETALHAAAAESLELSVGDTVTVGDRDLTVTGTWFPDDPDAAFWYGDPLETAGIDGSAYGPFVMPAEALAASDSTPLARWRVAPAPETVAPEDLSTVAAAVNGLKPSLEENPAFDVRGVVVTDEMAGMTSALSTDVDRAQSISLVPLVVLGVVGLIAGVQVARLLTVVRQEESTLFRSRGATTGQLVRWGAIEAGLIAVPSAALGAGVAAAALVLGVAETVDVTTIVLTGAVVALAAIGVLVVVAARAAAQKVEESVATASRRTSGAIGWSLSLGALIAAAITVWQLRQYGSGDGVMGADLLATPGPALALLGLAALALAVLPAPLAMAERRLAGRRQLGALLPAWEMSRRLPSYAAVVVLVAVTSGVGVLAAAYAATWTGLQEDVAGSRTGADVRADIDRLGPLSTGRPPTPVSRFETAEGVSEAVPGNVASARIGDAVSTVLAFPADAAESVVTVREDLFPVNGLVDGVAEEPGIGGAIPLPEHTTEIELTTIGAGAELIVSDPDGALAYLAAPEGVARVPDNFTAASILAIQLTRDAAGSAPTEPTSRTPVAVTGVTAIDDAGTETDVDVSSADWGLVGSEATAGDAPLSLAAPLNPTSETVRFAPAVDPAATVPAVLTGDLLAASGLSVGDTFTATTQGTQVNMRVADTADVVPGVDESMAMYVDLSTMNTMMVAGSGARPQGINQVWMSATEPASAAEAIRAADLGTSTVIDRESAQNALVERGLARQAVFAFWAVAIAGIVLTAIGAFASTATSQRQRSGELAVLRAVGVAPREQARARRMEQIGMSGVALVVGAVGGVVLAVLTAGVLAVAATSGVPDALVPVERWSGPALAAFVAALVATVVVVAATYARRVRREAATALPGSERR